MRCRLQEEAESEAFALATPFARREMGERAMGHEQPFRGSDESQQKRPKTILESVDDIRELIRQTQAIPTAPAKPAGSPPVSLLLKATDNDNDSDTAPYRPTLRPTMALLTVADDGGKDGEVIRIRKELFLIGRETGDLVIPHDTQISRTHAEISRRWDAKKERFRWYLRDLDSSNGTFVKVATSPLHHRQEMILGNTRFRFEAPSQGAASASASAAAGTMKWQRDAPGGSAAEHFAALVTLMPQHKEQRFSLVQDEYSIGRNGNVAAIVVDDPMLSPRHARIFRDAQGVWNLENTKSLNGIWLSIHEISIDRGGQFQCGEQRFAIRIP